MNAPAAFHTVRRPPSFPYGQHAPPMPASLAAFSPSTSATATAPSSTTRAAVVRMLTDASHEATRTLVARASSQTTSSHTKKHSASASARPSIGPGSIATSFSTSYFFTFDMVLIVIIAILIVLILCSILFSNRSLPKPGAAPSRRHQPSYPAQRVGGTGSPFPSTEALPMDRLDNKLRPPPPRGVDGSATAAWVPFQQATPPASPAMGSKRQLLGPHDYSSSSPPDRRAGASSSQYPPNGYANVYPHRPHHSPGGHDGGDMRPGPSSTGESTTSLNGASTATLAANSTTTLVPHPPHNHNHPNSASTMSKRRSLYGTPNAPVGTSRRGTVRAADPSLSPLDASSPRDMAYGGSSSVQTGHPPMHHQPPYSYAANGGGGGGYGADMGGYGGGGGGGGSSPVYAPRPARQNAFGTAEGTTYELARGGGQPAASAASPAPPLEGWGPNGPLMSPAGAGPRMPLIGGGQGGGGRGYARHGFY